MRQSRKIDHIKNALNKPDLAEAGFKDVHLLHKSIPEVNWDEIDTSCIFLGKRLAAPLVINAMTGGHPAVKEINKNLARAARETGVAIALGSQKAALENTGVIDTFQVVRKENPGGVVIANLSAHCTVDEAQRAIEMVEADALQLHVNVPQELAMAEGDRNFRGIASNISALVRQIDIPVIVKEVGFGMSMETVQQIYQAGVRIVDISGRGGTNFITIEEERCKENSRQFMGDVSDWGITTVTSIVEAKELNLPVKIVASGGLRTSYDISKSIALGADLTGISRPFLQTLIEQGSEGLVNHIQQLINGLRRIMMMCGAAGIQALQQVPVVITGNSAQWLKARGIDIGKYARKNELQVKD
ncbi:isopentenyl-diphosphate delta-isomerase [Desulfohalotomaculum tongense]|uniref:type 2 isopentenyl-diphosphate Delta-isomerase n=1 Tax=Desulforadius tongensis TaxID=1216062 RepID=UPI0019571E37|nr:type 2 isopentenyl-diphosphate Delta-isomerase [Desulforadius tongensis]MBM7855677.1 isopentenyl-diphosphate delta-isomerase [Desulforadius tongensis]